MFADPSWLGVLALVSDKLNKANKCCQSNFHNPLLFAAVESSETYMDNYHLDKWHWLPLLAHISYLL